MRVRVSLFAVLGMLLPFGASIPPCNAYCVVTSRTCVDPGGTRTMNGIAVTRDCWGYREEKTCFTADDGVDGCSTLTEDEATSGPGKCSKSSTECVESVTDIDGNVVCLKERETHQCETQITLPPLNASWSGTREVTETTEESSDCETLEKDATCTKGGTSCTGSACTRSYSCGGKTLTGCTKLTSLGCVRVKAPACDSSVDPACKVKVGTVRCNSVSYASTVASGEAAVTTETRYPTGRTTEDTSAIDAKQTATTTCTVVSSKCTDSQAGWRVIDGKSVYSTCWAYEKTLQCVDTTRTSSCTALEENGACMRESSSCTETGSTGTCKKESAVFLCGKGADDVPAGEAEFVSETSDVKGLVEVSDCETANAKCTKISETCTEAGGTRLVDGVPVTKDCWGKSLTFRCVEGTTTTPEVVETTDDCKELASDASCHVTEEVCLSTDAAGRCLMKTKTYVCGSSAKTVELGEICDDVLCIDGVCEESTGEASSDFLQGVALMEVAREAGVYGKVTNDAIFEGVPSCCSVKAAGFSCCKKANAETASAMNNEGFSVALTTGAMAGFEAVKTVGSPYVYDILSSHESLSGLLTAIYGDAGSGVYSPSFAFYGVSVGLDAGESLVLNFSPTGFFAAVAAQFLMEYFTCSTEDQLHVLRESQGLCHYVGSYCAKKSAGMCLTKKESWVCFNSKLARIVQEGARAQLGLGWGTPEHPLTRGLTLEEFKSLDFSTIDLTGVVAEVAKKAASKLSANPIDATATTKRAETRVTEIDATGKDAKAQYIPVNTMKEKCYSADGRLVNCTSITIVNE